MEASQLKKLLQQKINAANYSCTSPMLEQLFNYLMLLDKWNKAYNLTSIRDPKEMITLHILDSLSVNHYLQGQYIIDVGTGGGLPGIPLAIINPERKFVLLDSNGKKTRFLINVVQELKLANVEIIQERIEKYQPKEMFDTVISRAFSDINDFVLKTQHLLAQDGQFLAMKGQYPQAELAALLPQFKLLNSFALTVPDLAAERHLICLAKC